MRDIKLWLSIPVALFHEEKMRDGTHKQRALAGRKTNVSFNMFTSAIKEAERTLLHGDWKNDEGC